MYIQYTYVCVIYKYFIEVCQLIKSGPPLLRNYLGSFSYFFQSIEPLFAGIHSP